VDPWAAHDLLRDAFHAGSSESRELPRGELRVLGGEVCHKPKGESGPVPQQVGK
jgi:hypothetical protein